MKPSDSPLVSIITVSYNSAATIRETIESVIAQSYKNIQYIIIDGNSKDNTCDIVNEYRDKISVFISEKDQGIYDAMNKGLARATGDYIGILNSDDLYKDNTVIENIVNLFITYNKKIVSSSIEIFKDQPSNIIRKYSAVVWRKWMFRIGWQPPHPGFFVHKSVYEKTGNFDAEFKIGADFDFMLRCLLVHRFDLQKTNLISVSMRAGGESQKSLKNIIKTNREDHLSLRKNGFFSLEFFMYLKYPMKIFQFIFK